MLIKSERSPAAPPGTCAQRCTSANHCKQTIQNAAKEVEKRACSPSRNLRAKVCAMVALSFITSPSWPAQVIGLIMDAQNTRGLSTNGAMVALSFITSPSWPASKRHLKLTVVTGMLIEQWGSCTCTHHDQSTNWVL